ncbi:MAG: MotA/TolQ/ExbB proton channel family protein [Spirochaetes bacterium]|nr:MotA/TolQ/ExbB proton channel family protein [Spirochaetota bacterium]
MSHVRREWIAVGISVVVTVVFIALFTVFLGSGTAGVMLFGTDSSYYPFTLYNLMYLLFFIGLGQLWVRWLSTYEENVFLKRSGFLPEGHDTTLKCVEEIEKIRNNVINAVVRGEAFLPGLINNCINQYIKSHSVSDTISVLNSNLELNIHWLDLRYSMSRYIVWAIPTFGFIGTVVGISEALGKLDIVKFMGSQTDKVAQFRALASDLGFAFSTTIVALVLSAIFVFILHIIQRGEEEVLNKSGKYVLTNLINKLSIKE